MSASEPIAATFRAWYLAELASHYAQPCPDEVMDVLVDRTFRLADELATMPATNGDDLALKVFPLLLACYEPKSGDPPMLPNPESDNGSDALVLSVLADFRALLPIVAEAMGAPHFSVERKVA